MCTQHWHICSLLPCLRAGQGYRGRGRGRGRGFDDPDDIKYIKTLKGHTSQITAVVINPATGEVG